MREFLRKRPWIWIVFLLFLFVGANLLFLFVATSSHGPDLMPVVPQAER